MSIFSILLNVFMSNLKTVETNLNICAPIKKTTTLWPAQHQQSALMHTQKTVMHCKFNFLFNKNQHEPLKQIEVLKTKWSLADNITDKCHEEILLFTSLVSRHTVKPNWCSLHYICITVWHIYLFGRKLAKNIHAFILRELLNWEIRRNPFLCYGNFNVIKCAETMQGKQLKINLATLNKQ